MTAVLAGGYAVSHAAPPRPPVARIVTVECIGLEGAQSVYYELRAPGDVQDAFHRRFRVLMNEAEVPASSASVRKNFERVLEAMSIAGRVEHEILSEGSAGSVRVRELCDEQRATNHSMTDA